MTDLELEKRIDEIYPELVAMRRDFHQHPELGQEEIYTARQIHQYLESWNIDHQMKVADTGVVGIIYGRGKPSGQKRTVALRADMDALPMNEDKNRTYCSKNPNLMHACGHDAHMTIQLGAARLLKEMEDDLPGNIKLLFQPAEETIGGAKRMVEAGCMKNPTVDYVTGLHVMPMFAAGHVELKYGKLNAAADDVIISIYGKSAHGAYPQNGVDAVLIAATVVSSLQSLVSRNISPLNNAVLSFGAIEGGSAGNIICDKVILRGTLRTTDRQTRLFAIKTIRRQVENIAAAYGGEGTVLIKDGYAPLINSDEVVDVIAEVANEVVGQENVHFKEFPSLGAEDFSFFLDAAPGGFYHLGCGNEKKGITASLHSNQFDIDEECLKTGVKMQLKLALALLNK